MVDPKKPGDVGDLRKRLGLGGAAGPGGSSAVPPPAVGPGIPSPAVGPAIPPPVAPPPGAAGVPPPAVVVPPPVVAVRGAVPPPAFAAKPQVAVAPPPFWKRKKRVRKIIEEEFEDVEAGEDTAAKARLRTALIITGLVCIPVVGTAFYLGKQRQSWGLVSRSRGEATAIHEKLTKAGPVLEDISAKALAALNRAKANEVDTGFTDFTRSISESKPFEASDVDARNYAAFEGETVDRLFQLQRLVDDLWEAMDAHRAITRTDLGALQNHSKLEIPPDQLRYGFVLFKMDDYTLLGSIGVVSNPEVDDDGNQVFTIQERPGRPPHPLKVYTGGPFGERFSDWLMPVDPSQSAPNGPLGGAERSHMARYTRRLEEINELAADASTLQKQLASELGAIAE